MRRSDGIRRVFRLGIGGGDAEREVERELAHHFEATMAELRSRGLSDSESRAEARRRFGDERRYGRELRRLARSRDRRVRLGWSAGAAARSIGDAARGLLRAPALSLGVILVIGLGVGANATMFGMLDRLFLRAPDHVEDPDEVRRLFVTRRGPTGESFTARYHTYPDYRDWAAVGAFEGVAAYSPRRLTVGQGEAAERRPVTLITHDFLSLVGATPVLGRGLLPEDDDFGAEKVALLGHSFWRSRFGGRPDVIGESLDVGGATYTVVGVAPPRFTGVELERVDVWLPFHAAGEVEEGGREWVESRGWYWLQVVARLAAGVAPEAAAEAATVAHRRGRSEQASYDPEARVTAEPLLLARTSMATQEARVVPWLAGVAALVLLLTCANVANLLLARGVQRRRDAAVRLALGAGRARLIGGRVAEAVLLALVGGAAAYGLAALAGGVLRSLLLPEVGWGETDDAARILVFSAGVALLAGLLAGAMPAVRSSRESLVTADLKGTGRSGTREASRLRSSLTVLQAAVSVVLLTGTGLFVLSLRNARGVDLGFDPEPVLSVRLQPAGAYPGAEEMERLYREARRAVEGLAGVESTAILASTPFRTSRGIGDDLVIPGLDSLPRNDAGGVYIHAVSAGYAETLGVDVVRGRAFLRADDAETAPRVALVNEALATVAWPGEDPLGQCLVLRRGPCVEVVGVVANARRFDLEEEPAYQYYVPLAQAPYPWPPSDLMVRSARPEAVAGAVQRAIRQALPAVRLVTTEPYQSVLASEYRAWRLGATLFGAFGLLALVVAALGLYSVLAFDVAQRRVEIGVRGALGATRERVVGLVLRDALRLAGLGILAGLAVAAIGSRWLEPLLFRVPPRPPALLLGVAAAMLVVAALASGLPAWRAARVPPAEALQAE